MMLPLATKEASFGTLKYTIKFCKEGRNFMEQFGKSVCTQQPTTAEGNQKKPNYYKIGGATYLVTSHYKATGAVTALDKVARLIDKDTQTA